jgi:hypothetical protein
MNKFTNAWRSLLFVAAFFISFLSFGQSAGTIGLGVKGGDPTGLSVKFYRPSLSIELVVGRPYYFSGRYYDNSYYSKRFYKIDKYNYPYYKFGYYTARNPMAIQVHFLKSKATKTAKELKWYYGAGPQLRMHKIEYFYFDDRYRNAVYSEVYNNIDLGIDGVFGLEYTFSDLPLSIFADANIFLEIVDEVTLSPQGGLGVRFNIK